MHRAVLPPTHKNDAISDDVTQLTIWPRVRHFLATVLYKNVLYVPAPPFKKKVILWLSTTEEITTLKECCWLSFKKLIFSSAPVMRSSYWVVYVPTTVCLWFVSNFQLGGASVENLVNLFPILAILRSRDANHNLLLDRHSELEFRSSYAICVEDQRIDLLRTYSTTHQARRRLC